MKAIRFVRNPYTRLFINVACAIGNSAIGFLTHSWWFITVGAYYAILSITKFSILQIKRTAKGDFEKEIFARRVTGILLVALSVCIIGVNILCALKERGKHFHEIIMIAIATYTFTKVTVAIVGLVKARRSISPITKTMRNISLADACVSIYSMQRSMLVSFPGMSPWEIQLFNILTGTAVWIVLLLLGFNLIGGKRIYTAKSMAVKIWQAIAKAVTNGYKTVENGVVTAYTRIADKFVDTYLKKDGETVKEAKSRIKKKQR